MSSRFRYVLPVISKDSPLDERLKFFLLQELNTWQDEADALVSPSQFDNQHFTHALDMIRTYRVMLYIFWPEYIEMPKIIGE